MSASRRRGRPAPDAARKSAPYRTCPFCGKRGYPDRRTAKAVARELHEPDALKVYKCWKRPDDDPGLFAFHFGHKVPARFRGNGGDQC